MHILCAYTDQKLAQQGQKNSKSVLSALPTFRISGFRLVNFRREFLYMYGSQEKNLGQKVNVKFFTVDPYSVGTGVPRPFSKFANYWKNIFLKIKTSKIKSEKNIYQTIHSTRFIFWNFYYFFCIFPDFF